MNINEHNTNNKIPLSTKLWLSGADGLVVTLSGLITGGGMTYYFTKCMGLKSSYASIVWLLFGIWNAINAPLFGYISDRTKTKLGRRIPYIRYGAPFYSLVFILSWVSFPWAGNQVAMFLQMLVSLYLFDILYLAISTSIFVMPFELTVDNEARGSILLWRIVFDILALAFPLIVMPLIQPNPGESATNFRITMTIIGILAGVLIYFSTYFYKEHDYIKEEKQPPIFTAIIACFKNRPFLIYEIINFTMIYSQTALMQGVLYYFAEFEVPMTYCYIPLVLGAILGMFLWKRYQEPFGLNRCTALMCLFLGVSCLVMAFFGGYTLAAIFGFFTFGIGFAGGMYLLPLMNGDVIDYDELKTGLRREGMYAGVNSFITKPGISLAQSAFLAIITAYGYVQNLAQGSQTEHAKQGVLIGWMLIPAILLFICFFVMFTYPLHGQEWKEKKAMLVAIHQEKENQNSKIAS